MIKHILKFGLYLVISISISSCLSLKIWLDRIGIDDVAEMILADFQSESANELKSYLERQNSYDSLLAVEPDKIKVSSLKDWRLKDVPIQQKVTFPSTLKLDNGESDTAVFYLYSHSELKGQDVILWIPGFGVSDLAFRFIDTFFVNELNAGYAVLFYNIPYHLNRIQEGEEMGQGLFTGNNRRNLEVINHVLYEINSAIKYLESNEVKSISGWGGSIGAAFLWLASESYHFEHMTLMIPIVDWTSLIFHERMNGVVNKMNDNGITNELLKNAYFNVSPFHVPTQTNPENIQILYSKHDQFTPERLILEFAGKWNITNFHGYNESHASILINDQIYKDNQQFLKQLTANN